MRIPDSLISLSEYGIIEQVLRPLMSGKEAQIYLVISGGVERVAKVYKDAQNRTFKNRAEYTEGRKVRNTRDQRAMGKGSRHGRAQEEAAWRATEVDMIYRLRDAGVRVPVPYHFIDSVLVMEMVADAEGNPAPRLGDLELSKDEARAIFERLLSEVVRMLAAGVVHGDLSDFNVLVGTDGPVVIDFPQAVDASSNANARKLLIRDVDNLHRFMARFDPEHRALPYAQEMWQLYERSMLTPDTKLTGRHRASEQKANTKAVLDLIGDAEYDERRRRQNLGLKPLPGANPARAPMRPNHAGEVERPVQATRTPHPAQRRVEVVIAPAAQQRGRGQQQAPRQQHPGQQAPRQQHSGQQAPRQHSGQQAPRQHSGQQVPRQHSDQQAPRQHSGQQTPRQAAEPATARGQAVQHDRPREQTRQHERPRQEVRQHEQSREQPRQYERPRQQAQEAARRPEQSAAQGGAGQAAVGAQGAGGAAKRRRARRRRRPGPAA